MAPSSPVKLAGASGGEGIGGGRVLTDTPENFLRPCGKAFPFLVRLWRISRRPGGRSLLVAGAWAMRQHWEMQALNHTEIKVSVESLKTDLRALRLEHVAEQVRQRVAKAQAKRWGQLAASGRTAEWRSTADPLEVLALSRRAQKVLCELEAGTLRQLCAQPPRELLRLRNCGLITIVEIQARLLRVGLSLKISAFDLCAAFTALGYGRLGLVGSSKRKSLGLVRLWRRVTRSGSWFRKTPVG